jgi:hypothetical protein
MVTSSLTTLVPQIVLSAVFASSWTTFASILVAILDGVLGVSTILPLVSRVGLLESSQRRLVRGTKKGGKLLGISVKILADTQSITGLALLTSAYINLPQNPPTGAKLLNFQAHISHSRFI